MRNERLRKVREEILRYRMICFLCVFITVAITVVYQCKLFQNQRSWEQHLKNQEEFWNEVGYIINELRTYEYRLNLLNAEIKSEELSIEQNIDTAYCILQAKSSRTTDDELMRVINERVIVMKDTMTTADLFQAIDVMKENFPAASYEELDSLYNKNVELLEEIYKEKKEYNRMINEYESIIRSNTAALQLVNFSNYQFERYEEEEPARANTKEETEPETVYVEPMAVG